MPRKVLKPASLDFQPRPTYPYSPGAMGGGMVYTAGQVAWDASGALVGGNDLQAQARQCLANLKAVLASQGATPADLVRIRTYVVNHTPDMLGPVSEELMAFYGDAVPAPNTWISVPGLALPDFLIEIEGTAVLR